ncbi:hypothetical protein AXI59_02030 [Bacillus nakamurai]|uniref:Uncharacterized protein n=1 Tax=Bacillus nakamurai TaxID=1793963 RepID=A0A150F3V5_9BACI|nr:hypothetical protein [Bacillus nakamurai]KXZ15300.1 hypothetical protein AXI58_03310 [Bacillus nakamurai]KXZ16686.1 hypothetical protein AXI59_02030 [Bacillus nakamurai]MED1226894.1 hypothetical protein [Bacillus nakamurai]
MSLLTEAYDLLTAQDNPLMINEDYVFMHTVPVVLPDGTGLKDAKNAIVKISHILNKRARYASNFSQEIQTSVQIQIWYEYDDSLAEQYDDLLNDYFESNGFYSFESYISVDPDIEKLYLTAKFKKTSIS